VGVLFVIRRMVSQLLTINAVAPTDTLIQTVNASNVIRHVLHVRNQERIASNLCVTLIVLNALDQQKINAQRVTKV
jgi:hypothetical protein